MVGTVKKSRETRSRTWLSRNGPQVWHGGVRRFGISRDTVRSDTSMPSLRRAPQSGFAVAIRLTRALISALTGKLYRRTADVAKGRGAHRDRERDAPGECQIVAPHHRHRGG